MTLKGFIRAINTTPGWVLATLYSIGIISLVVVFFASLYLHTDCPAGGHLAECRINSFRGVDPVGTTWYNYTFWVGTSSKNLSVCMADIQCVVVKVDDFYPVCSHVNGTHGRECMDASYSQLYGVCIVECVSVWRLVALLLAATVLFSYVVAIAVGVCCDSYDTSEQLPLVVNADPATKVIFRS